MKITESKIEISHLRPWSFSKIQKAKRCAYDFYWTYVEKLEPADRAEFFVLGSGVHFILENALNTLLKRCRPLNYDLLDYFFEQFKAIEPTIKYKAVKFFYPKILSYINGYLRKIEKIDFFKCEVNLCVDRDFKSSSFKGSDAFLRGKADIIYGFGDTLFIVDHKTNRVNDFSNRLKTQLRWYALLAFSNYSRYKKFALEVHNVRYGSVRRFIFTETDILNFKLKLLSIIDNIEVEFKNKTFEELFPTPSSTNCKWCDFRHVCSAKKS